MNWVLYKEVSDGERVWRSYYCDSAIGTIFRDSIAFLDRSSGAIKCTAESSIFVAEELTSLTWSKESESRKGERLEELFSAPITGGKIFLNITSFIDPAGGLIKSATASAALASSWEVGGVQSVNTKTGVVVLGTDDIAEGATNKYFASGFAAATTDGLTEGATNLYYHESAVDARIVARIMYFDSAASVGGAATEALTVTGILATDTILSVSQMTPGANSLPLLGFSTLIADGLTGIWSADPGAGAVVRVAVLR